MKEEVEALLAKSREFKNVDNWLAFMAQYRVEHGNDHCDALKAYMKGIVDGKYPVPKHPLQGTPEKLIKRVDPV